MRVRPAGLLWPSRRFWTQTYIKSEPPSDSKQAIALGERRNRARTKPCEYAAHRCRRSTSRRCGAIPAPILPLLALPAPWEQGGREVCRIAVSFLRRAGLFLWRIRIWLHHLAIDMPRGMTEHRQNDSETDEER